MFNPKRLWMVLSSALTLGVAGVLVLAATAPGSSALRAVANNLTVAAHAAGGGGGGVVTLIYPGFTSAPLKRGTALATASVSACSTAVMSGPFGACDFGSAGPLTISIK